MSVQGSVHEMKRIAPGMAAVSGEMKNRALLAVAEALSEKKEELFAANTADLKKAAENGLKSAVLGRLKFDEHKLAACVEGLKQLAALPDPVGRVLLDRELDEGLELRRVSVPIGVIGVIFEARPDAMIQIAGLCIKSGNCAVLKGGREATETNRAVFGVIRDAVAAAGLPANCLLQVSAHEEIDELLKLDRDVDLIIPRGSNAFVRHIMENTKIPVLGHADGICHIYVDEKADQAQAVPLIIDAKTQYPAACNAVETVLVHQAVSVEFLPVLVKALRDAGVTVHGDEASAAIVTLDGPCLSGEDYRREYGDLEIALRIVRDTDEAIDHINTFGSHHTDAILTEDDAAAEHFFSLVDSAGVYRNCSTRFADGFRYGFGAEVGISTGKIHARGPVGLEGLTTYRYQITGHGQTVGDYAEGRRAFHFRDLP
ncbi:MAG: glutamate-5-semialdehyde dehydrogenase [Lachnospiraceae bacterium]|nr:glutamate-5-semialdehyde dehydrogenase [Lachnospiraceae bacterium]